MLTDLVVAPKLASDSDLTSTALAAATPRVVWIGGIPWKIAERVMMPLTMPHVPLRVDRDELRKVMARERALLAAWTTGWDQFSESEWWWNCCDLSDYDLETLDSSRGRRSIRKGLRDCTVEIIDAEQFAHHAYPIHAEAVRSYAGTPPSPDEYAAQIRRMAEYPGTELWAAFVGERMAAFATCQVIDDAVTLGSTKSDASLSRHNANAALFYSICKHSLDRGLRYVSNGSRTLWHPTSINDFLQTLGFRRVYCQVNVEASPALRLIDRMRLATWGRRLGLANRFGKRWMQLEGCHRLFRIAETFG